MIKLSNQNIFESYCFLGFFNLFYTFFHPILTFVITSHLFIISKLCFSSIYGFNCFFSIHVLGLSCCENAHCHVYNYLPSSTFWITMSQAYDQKFSWHRSICWIYSAQCSPFQLFNSNHWVAFPNRYTQPSKQLISINCFYQYILIWWQKCCHPNFNDQQWSLYLDKIKMSANKPEC